MVCLYVLIGMLLYGRTPSSMAKISVTTIGYFQDLMNQTIKMVVAWIRRGGLTIGCANNLPH